VLKSIKVRIQRLKILTSYLQNMFCILSNELECRQKIFNGDINAGRAAADYKKEVRKVSGNDKLTIHLASDGGWTGRIYRVEQ